MGGTENHLGWTQQEISDKLQELWPDAKGTSRETVKDILAENGKLPLSAKILADIKEGHSVEKVGQRATYLSHAHRRITSNPP